jgi:hypothetical protein
LDDCLINALANNSPSIFRNHQSETPHLAKIDCGNGWYHVLNHLAFELISLSQKSGFQISITHACSRLGGLHVRWKSVNELLACEREDVTDLLLYHKAMSRFQCEVCGRYLARENPLNPRCEFHRDEQHAVIVAGAASND